MEHDDLFRTVCLTRVGRRGSTTYTTNAGAIKITKQIGDIWAVGPAGAGERYFRDDLTSLEEAVDWILDARDMMRTA